MSTSVASESVNDFARVLAAEPDRQKRDALISRAELTAMQMVDGDVLDQAQSALLSQRVKLGQLLRDGVPPPTFLPSPTLGERLFYEHRLSLLAGHKKAGKSWATTLQARDLLNAGRPVVYIDNENGAKLFTARLALVGATAEAADEHLHYLPFPTLGHVDSLREEFDAIAEALPGAVVILDSLRTFMSKFGLDANANADVERFCGPIMASLKTTEQLTVLIIDHANRTTRDTDEYVATGAAAKAQAVDAVYFVKKETPFSRDVQGLVKLTVKDDREGLLDFERFYKVGGQGENKPLFFEHAQPQEVGVSGRIRSDLREVLAEQPGKPFSKRSIRSKVKGDNNAIDAALEALVSDPCEPIFADVEGKKPPVYVWDEQRAKAAGMEF